MFKHKTNKTSGITLIALVVTIIVLLILAGISIQMLTGDNGILIRTGDAKDRTERAEIEEALKMEYISQIGNDIVNYSHEVSLGKVVETVKNQGYKVGSQPASEEGAIEDVRLKNGDASIELEDGQTELEIELVRGTNTGDVYYAEINGTKYEITDSTGKGDIKISKTPLTTGTVTEPTITVTATNTGVATVTMSQDGKKIVVTPIKKGSTDVNVTVEGTSISNKKAGELTITGPLLVGERSTETVKDNYTDLSTSKKKATIPAGFTVSGITGEQNIDDGLVIYLIPDGVTPDWTTRATGDAFSANTVYDIQTKYDQFVWIPVDQANKPMYKVATATGYASTDANNPNYEGVLYSDYNTTPNSGQMSSYGQGADGRYREPDTISSYDNNSTYLGVISTITGDITSYINMAKFQETMQNDYNEMVKSVEYYGGFWIGRYEASLVDGKTRVIAGQTSMNNADTATESTKNAWFGLYARQKKFEADAKALVPNLDSNLKSGMIWGSQWDSMLNWMVAKEINVTSAAPSGASRNTSRITGATKNGSDTFNDKLKNIYDILGNSREWTAVAVGTYHRNSRGGGSPSNSYSSGAANGSDNTYGSRPYLIVSRSGN